MKKMFIVVLMLVSSLCLASTASVDGLTEQITAALQLKLSSNKG